MSSGTQASGEQERDSADLARFGYSQELKRSLGLFSSFAVAFSYISPSTGIFTLFALGLTDRKSTRLNSSHLVISYAVFCLKKKEYRIADARHTPSHSSQV